MCPPQILQTETSTVNPMGPIWLSQASNTSYSPDPYQLMHPYLPLVEQKLNPSYTEFQFLEVFLKGCL